MERTHHRHRIIELAKSRADDALARLRSRDEKALERYAYLQTGGYDLQDALDKAGHKLQRGLLISFFACVLMFAAAALLGLAGQDLATLLQRPDYGEGDASANVILSLSYGGDILCEAVDVDVPQKELTRAQADALFDRCEDALQEYLQSVQSDGLRGDLSLPQSLEDGLVRVGWESSDAARLNADGRVNLVGAKEGAFVELIAVLSAEEFVRRRTFSLRLSPQGASDLSGSLALEKEALLQQLPVLLTDVHQSLPEESPFGASASWTLPETGLPWEVFAAFLLLATFLIFSRTDAIKRELKKRHGAFEREIPNMTMQMILLLDAGLTVENAFDRLIRENEDSEEPLYRALSQLHEESRSTNLPFVNALYVFARQSGIRDLVRFASLALDCSGRGSELSDKLDRERQQIWNTRLQAAKGRAREAETKLCLPLMLLLLVLVVIAIAPALMEM